MTDTEKKSKSAKTDKKPSAAKTATKKSVAKNVKETSSLKKPSKKSPKKAVTTKEKPNSINEILQAYSPDQIKAMTEQAAYFAAQNDGNKQNCDFYWNLAVTQIEGIIKPHQI